MQRMRKWLGKSIVTMALGAGLLLAQVALHGQGVAQAGQDHTVRPMTDASPWHSNDHSRIRLISAGQNEDGSDLAGVQFDLDEGWHTYWRSPGRFGIPASFNWEGSENIRGVEVRWPEPEYITFDDYEAYGYHDRLVLPLVIARDDPAAAAVLQLAIGYAVCETVCIPATGFVSILLPPVAEVSEPNPEYSYLVREALALVPTTDIESVGIEVAPALLVRQQGQTRVLRITAWSQSAWHDPRVIVEGPKGLHFGSPKIVLDPTSRHLVALVSVTVTELAEGEPGQGIRATITGGLETIDVPLAVTVTGNPQSIDD